MIRDPVSPYISHEITLRLMPIWLPTNWSEWISGISFQSFDKHTVESPELFVGVYSLQPTFMFLLAERVSGATQSALFINAAPKLFLAEKKKKKHKIFLISSLAKSVTSYNTILFSAFFNINIQLITDFNYGIENIWHLYVLSCFSAYIYPLPRRIICKSFAQM